MNVSEAAEPIAPTAVPTVDEVFAVVVEVLSGIVGEDYLEALEVTPETRFEADLELESMEIVQMAEELVARYPGVDFMGWFATMELEELIDLGLGTVSRFIVESCASKAA